MLTITLTRGLPGSGKSTWAKQQVLDAPNGSIKRVNKDSLREMLDVSRWSKLNENFLLNVRDFIIIEALKQGKHVIVDDTNLEDSHYNRISGAIEDCIELNGHQIKVQYEDFTHVPIETCIERDIKRANGVGEKVIRDMYDCYLAPSPLPAPEYDRSLPDAIMVDLDGTMSLNDGHRGWHDYAKVINDKPLPHNMEIVKRFAADHQVIIVSGRDDSCKNESIEWLNTHGIFPDLVLMRVTGDNRDDAIVKGELYEAHILNRYNVKFVLDDRDRVVQKWRSLGLFCLQVQKGDF